MALNGWLEIDVYPINLFPWRETRIEDDRKALLFSGLLGLLFAAITLMFISYHLDREIGVQQARNAYLGDHISRYDSYSQQLKSKQQEFDQLTQQVDVAVDARREARKPSILMNLLSELSSEELYIEKVVLNGAKVEVSGVGKSAMNIARWLAQLKAAPMIMKVKLHFVQNASTVVSHDSHAFFVSFTLSQEEESDRQQTLL